MVTVSFNSHEKAVDSLLDLDRMFCGFEQHDQFELGLSIADGPSICMLRNGEHAFVMYMRFPGDSGFVSIGASMSKEQVQYTLGNGQVDEYPRSWCIPTEQCFQALMYFFVNDGARPEGIAWHESH